MAIPCSIFDLDNQNPRIEIPPQNSPSIEEMIDDFQQNAFDFTCHRVTLAGRTIEETLQLACEILYEEPVSKNEPAELPKQEQMAPPEPESCASELEPAQQAQKAPAQSWAAATWPGHPTPAESASAIADTLRIKKIPPCPQPPKSEDVAPQSSMAENDGFGSFEEEFFESYVPPAQPLTKEELMEMKEGPAAKYLPKKHSKKHRGFLGWLTAVFSS